MNDRGYAIQMIDEVYDRGGEDVPLEVAMIMALGYENGTKVTNEIISKNPSVNSGCTNLQIGQSLCVGAGQTGNVGGGGGQTGGGQTGGGQTNNGTCGTGQGNNAGSGNGGGSGCKSYVVKAGDTCWAISQANGISVADVIAKNSGVNSGCTNLQVGQSLCV